MLSGVEKQKSVTRPKQSDHGISIHYVPRCFCIRARVPVLFYDYFGDFGALTADEDAVGGFGYAHAVEVEVFHRRVKVGVDAVYTCLSGAVYDFDIGESHYSRFGVVFQQEFVGIPIRRPYVSA